MTRTDASEGQTFILSGLLINRPAIAATDTYYWATDQHILYRYNGVSWEVISARPPIFIPVVDPDSNIGTYPAIELTDGVDITVRALFQLPTDMVSISASYVIVVPGGTGNFRRSVATNFASLGQAYNTHVGAIAAGEVAVTINLHTGILIDAALAGAVGGDLVGIEFTRAGSHANDTVNANCYYLGILIIIV